MRIVYEGSLPRVSIPLLRGLTAERGVPLEVPDSVGAALLEQRTWQPAGEVEIPSVDGEQVPFSEGTVEGLKQQASEWDVVVPSGARKADIVELLEAEAKRRAAIDAPPLENDDDE